MADKPYVYPFRRKAADDEATTRTGNADKRTGRLHKRKERRLQNAEPAATYNAKAAKAAYERTAWEEKFWGGTGMFSDFSVVDVFCLLAAFLLGRAEVLGSLYPFGVAFAGASVLKYCHLAGVLLPLVAAGQIAALRLAAWPYVAAVGLTCLLLYLQPRDEKRDWVRLPAFCAATLIVFRALALLLQSTLSPYALVTICFEACFAAGLSLILQVALGILQEISDIKTLSADELVCLFVLFLGTLCGVGSFAIFDLQLRDIISRFLVMLAAFWGGAGAGAGVGALMGIMPSLDQAISPAMIGLYAFAGLLAGAFKSFAKPGVSLGFLLGNVMLGLYVLSINELQHQLLASLPAVAVLLILPDKWLKKGERIFTGMNLKSVEEENNRRRLRFSARRLQSAAQIFRELAISCQNGAANDADQQKSIEMVLNHLCGQVCNRCSIKNLCWSVDVEETYRGVMGLFAVAETKGFAEVKDMPENFAKRCPHLRELVATINCLYELYCQSNYWQQQKSGSRLFLSGQLAGSAEVMEKLAAEMQDAGGNLNYVEKALARRFAKHGLAVNNVQITHLGDKNLDFWANLEECPGEVACRDMAAREVSRVLQKKFRTQEVSCGGGCGAGCCFHMLKEGANTLLTGKAQLSKDGNPICGDSGDSVTLGEGRQLLMISDGMGAGLPEALKSGTAVNMLTHLLEVGFNRHTAVDTVNTVLMLSGGEEAFVTLDMCIIDRYDNTAEFIKTGAAPSFIRHDGRVQMVKNASLPVGMLQTVDKSVYTTHLAPGDMVIMASDGLLDVDSEQDVEWLISLIEENKTNDPQEMAEFLLERAVGICGGRVRDDITVLTAAIA